MRYNHDDFIFLSCERSKVFDGPSGAVAFQQISMRRFCARPFGVSFEATGCVSPKPLAIDGDFSIPQILQLRDVRWRIVNLSRWVAERCGVSYSLRVRLGRVNFARASTVGVRAVGRLCKFGK